jgi:hypothetical protein
MQGILNIPCYGLGKCPPQVHVLEVWHFWEVVEPLRGRVWWEVLGDWEYAFKEDGGTPVSFSPCFHGSLP